MTIEFTVDHDHTFAGESGIEQIIGWITFSVSTYPGDFRVREQGAGTPRVINLPSRRGWLATDGHLYKDQTLAAPCRLVANSPAFNLQHLTYRADFELTTVLGDPIAVPHCWFPAPGTDTTLQLTRVMGDPSQPVMEVRAKCYVEDILDLNGNVSNSYMATFGNGEDTSYPIVHSLGTTDVSVSTYLVSTGEEVDCDVVRTDGNTVTLTFASPPEVDTLRVVVIGTAFGIGSPVPTDSLGISDATATGRSLLTAVDAAAARAAIGVAEGDGLEVTSIDLGGTSDTTLTRSAAGKLAVEGVDVVLTGGPLGTPSSGNLAGCTFPTLNQNTTGSAATLTTARTIDGQSFNGSANVTVIAPGTHAATSKTTPVDADEIPLVDSEASNVLKKLTWANLKATAKTYYDAVTSTLTNKSIDLGSNTVTGTTAQFNTALSDNDFATLAGSETFTNKTLTTPTLTTPVINGTSTGTGLSTGATVSTLAMRDSNAYLWSNGFAPVRASVATAAGTSTMTVATVQVLVYTGSTTQTVKLPTTSVLAGMEWTIINQSSGDVTVQSSGANTIATLTGAADPSGKKFLCLKDTPTTDKHWREI